MICQEETEQALWGKAQEWGEGWGEEPGIVREQVPEEIAYVLACGEKVPHQAGTPCASMNCPKCGVRMVRE